VGTGTPSLRVKLPGLGADNKPASSAGSIKYEFFFSPTLADIRKSIAFLKVPRLFLFVLLVRVVLS
jgi:hypothetical protein